PLEVPAGLAGGVEFAVRSRAVKRGWTLLAALAFDQFGTRNIHVTLSHARRSSRTPLRSTVTLPQNGKQKANVRSSRRSEWIRLRRTPRGRRAATAERASRGARDRPRAVRAR